MGAIQARTRSEQRYTQSWVCLAGNRSGALTTIRIVPRSNCDAPSKCRGTLPERSHLPALTEIRTTGEVYERTNQPAEAAKARWDSILAYMDSDQLDRAGQALKVSDVRRIDKETPVQSSRCVAMHLLRRRNRGMG